MESMEKEKISKSVRSDIIDIVTVQTMQYNAPKVRVPSGRP